VAGCADLCLVVHLCDVGGLFFVCACSS
jgi:hypothetical protein